MSASSVGLIDGGKRVGSDNPLHVTSSATTGTGYASSATKTRPADTTAYSANEVIAEDSAAGTDWDFTAIGPESGRILITGVALRIDVNAVPAGMGSFRLHLYNAAPTAINDNAAFNLPAGDRAKYLGFLEVSTPEDHGDTLFVQNDDVRKQIDMPAGTTLYGITETRGAFTPTSAAVFTWFIKAVRVE